MSTKDFSSKSQVDGREVSAASSNDRHGLATNPAEAMLIRFQFQFLIHESKELIPATVVEKASECS